MNRLERSLLERAGQDSGWERVLRSDAEQVLLASARHRCQVPSWPIHCPIKPPSNTVNASSKPFPT